MNLKKTLLYHFSSTARKLSLHIIHANPTGLFENNSTFALLLKAVIHLILVSIIKHKCCNFDITNQTDTCSISDLIAILSPMTLVMRKYCTQCHILMNNIIVSEFAYLLILDEQKQRRLAIDMNVYNKNQQFRMYQAVKIGKNVSFDCSIEYPFDQQSSWTQPEILEKSLISYNIQNCNLPIFVLIHDHFDIMFRNQIDSYIRHEVSITSLQAINNHFNRYFTLQPKSITESPKPINKINFINKINTKIVSFVERLITQDPNYQGYIESYIIGNYDANLLFFNISGNYRFCPIKGDHHKRNSISIIVHKRKFQYAVRCKDTNCSKKNLLWKDINQS